jgi:hypothetical protein|tara:strand:- start:143 stop:403 length:261 start_codon:yes stop_codon:yes gene_type:complete
MEHMGMFIVGAIIFVLYLAGYLFMIKYANDGQRRDMARDDKFEYYQRHNQPNPADYDGMGNYSRFPSNVNVGKKLRLKKKKVKTKV